MHLNINDIQCFLFSPCPDTFFSLMGSYSRRLRPRKGNSIEGGIGQRGKRRKKIIKYDQTTIAKTISKKNVSNPRLFHRRKPSESSDISLQQANARRMGSYYSNCVGYSNVQTAVLSKCVRAYTI
jgi:hypothetical protein